ncbi:hypothetical protein B0H11DRAFT_2251842 [Mycena galericulata]|nr:hypothetical protein B0H11DRAFT_2251842 [Mycena galericulata]
MPACRRPRESEEEEVQESGRGRQVLWLDVPPDPTDSYQACRLLFCPGQTFVSHLNHSNDMRKRYWLVKDDRSRAITLYSDAASARIAMKTLPQPSRDGVATRTDAFLKALDWCRTHHPLCQQANATGDCSLVRVDTGAPPPMKRVKTGTGAPAASASHVSSSPLASPTITVDTGAPSPTKSVNTGTGTPAASASHVSSSPLASPTITVDAGTSAPAAYASHVSSSPPAPPTITVDTGAPSPTKSVNAGTGVPAASVPSTCSSVKEETCTPALLNSRVSSSPPPSSTVFDHVPESGIMVYISGTAITADKDAAKKLVASTDQEVWPAPSLRMAERYLLASYRFQGYPRVYYVNQCGHIGTDPVQAYDRYMDLEKLSRELGRPPGRLAYYTFPTFERAERGLAKLRAQDAICEPATRSNGSASETAGVPVAFQ